MSPSAQARFEARLDPSAYADAEAVGLAVVGGDEPGHVALDERWCELPEPLWSRLMGIGRAYELDFPDQIRPRDDTLLGPEQCRVWAEELQFIGRLVADPALHGVIALILAELGTVLDRTDQRLLISPP